jgi:hypothetical protein
LMAQPPLLFQEGNTQTRQFIHTFIDRRYSPDVPLYLLLIPFPLSIPTENTGRSQWQHGCYTKASIGSSYV